MGTHRVYSQAGSIVREKNNKKKSQNEGHGGMFDTQKLDFGLYIADRGCAYGPFVSQH